MATMMVYSVDDEQMRIAIEQAIGARRVDVGRGPDAGSDSTPGTTDAMNTKGVKGTTGLGDGLMDILYLLIPLSVVLALLILLALWWAVYRGQFGGVEQEGERILRDG